MRIAYNPRSEGAITTLPSGYENDIVFDLSGLAVYAKGVKFKGTDTTYDVFKKHTTSGDTGGNNGLVPVPSYNNNSKTRYLREDGTWVVPTNYYRPISVGGISILGNNNTALNLVAGSFIKLTPETNSSGAYTGKVTISATYANATQTADGLMSSADKKKLDGLNFSGDFNGTLENAFTKFTIGDIDLLSVTNPHVLFKPGLGIALSANTTDNSIQIAGVVMTGASSSADGVAGLVPVATKGNQNKFLRGDGTWQIPTNYTTHLYVGAVDTNTNAATSNGGTYLKLFDNSTLRHQYIIKGTGRVTVTSDSSGNISINTPTTIAWGDVTGKPSTYTPSSHTHPTSQITALTDYAKATTNAALTITDTLNVALGKLEYKADLGVSAYNWYKSVTGTDNDDYINKWEEIVDFLDSVKEGTDILTEFVTVKTPQTVSGDKTFSGIVQVTTLHAPTSNGGTTYGAGSNNQVLKSNGTTVYWAADSNSNTWRAIQANGTQIAGTETGTYALNFVSGTGITVSGTAGSSSTANKITITNAGVRAVTINGNYLKVNTNGTEVDLTINYAKSAASLTGGAKGNIVYQSDANVTAFLANPTTNNYVLKFNTSTGLPYWAADSNTWTALKGATSSAAGTAGYAPQPVAGQQNYILLGNATWTSPASITVGKATNLAGGGAGQIPYQSGVGTTSYLAVPTANGMVLKYDTARSAPYWASDNNSDYRVTTSPNATAKGFITGTTSSTENTGTLIFDNAVYLGTAAGSLYATNFYGTFNGNATTASALSPGAAINGTTFTGASAITTARWGTARNISITDGTNTSTAVSVNGSAAVSLNLPATIKANFVGNLTGTADVATKLGTTTLGGVNKPIYLKDGAPTECNTYAGGTAVTLNGSSKAASTASFYAPTTAGTNGYVLKSSGTGAPTWVNINTLVTGVSVNTATSGNYTLVGHDGNTLYSKSGIYLNAASACLYAAHYYETSDIKFKTNVKPILSSDNIPTLREFIWKKDGSKSYGFIAQELEAQGYSELVDTSEDGTKTVNYSAALSLTVAKLQTRIDELEKQLKEVKNG